MSIGIGIAWYNFYRIESENFLGSYFIKAKSIAINDKYSYWYSQGYSIFQVVNFTDFMSIGIGIAWYNFYRIECFHSQAEQAPGGYRNEIHYEKSGKEIGGCSIAYLPDARYFES